MNGCGQACGRQPVGRNLCRECYDQCRLVAQWPPDKLPDVHLARGLAQRLGERKLRPDHIADANRMIREWLQTPKDPRGRR